MGRHNSEPFINAEVSFLFLFYRNIEIPKVVTLNIFHCQTNTDNGSDTSFTLTRSSPKVVLLNELCRQVNGVHHVCF